jgi:glycosyltransferase involved in cell wall biosynthesis
MKLCLVGHFTQYPDEGVRNVAIQIAKTLEHNGLNVKKINVSESSYWREIKAFRPDIIHFILSPTLSGFIIAKFISFLHPKAKSIISAIQPDVPSWKFLSLFRPDIVLLQSYESEKVFKLIGCQTIFLPNGVDIEKFEPVDVKTKQELRKKYAIPDDKFIILHVASLKKERNLDIFKKLQQYEENQVMIIGRTGEKVEVEVMRELQNAGCIVWIKYLANIEEIYALSDCYVFPTLNRRYAIEMPLSVLEAMACNLPILSTRFGALPRVFKEGDGIFFVENESDFLIALDEVKTREKVLPYSWENNAKKIEDIYEVLLR